MWRPGDAITVSFVDGTKRVQERVMEVAAQWLDHANLELRLGTPPKTDVRISFQKGGSWSYIGTECRSIPRREATMNLGWLTAKTSDVEAQRVVLHEFGHALGCIHEHENPRAGIKWNRPAVYGYYAGPPNHWSPEEVDENLFSVYSRDLTVHTKLDPKSIMLYPIDRRHTLDGFHVGLNIELSETDKRFIRKRYP
jgi:serralysin